MMLGLKTALIVLLATASSLVCASDAGTKLSLSMELMEGETVVGKPRLVVMTGRHARVEIGAVPLPAGTNAATQLGWQVDVVPMMASPDEVKTSLDITFTAAGDGGVTSTRSMSVDTRQKLGKTIVIQIPGTEGQQPLSLSLKTDLATQ